MHGTLLATLLAREHNSDTHSDPESFRLHGAASMVWSPMGTIIAYDTELSVLRWWDADTLNQPSHVGGIPSSNGATPYTVTPPNGSCCLTRRRLAEPDKQPTHDIGDTTGIGNRHSCYYSIFSSDGGRLIASYDDGSILIWDISELENIPPSHELPLCSDQMQSAAQTSSSGREVLVRHPRFGCTSVEIWDTHTDARIASLEHEHEVSIATYISPGGKFVVTSTYVQRAECIIYLWRVSDGACLQAFEVKGYNVHVLTILFTADGQTLVYGYYDDGIGQGTIVCRSIEHLLMEGDTD